MQTDAKNAETFTDAIECEQNILNHYHSAMEKHFFFGRWEMNGDKKKHQTVSL